MQALYRWDRVPTLSTARLDLRALAARDRSDLFTIYGDPDVMLYSSDPAFPQVSYVDQLLASVALLFAHHEALVWAVTLQTTQQLVGTCELHSFEPHERRAEVGCLLAQAYWGQGLMPEALHAVIDFGVRQLGLATLRADIDGPNVRSRALFQRLGFRPVAASDTLFDLVVG